MQQYIVFDWYHRLFTRAAAANILSTQHAEEQPVCACLTACVCVSKSRRDCPYRATMKLAFDLLSVIG